MFSFANPEYLYLLLLLPVVAGLFWLAQRAKAKKIAKFGRTAVVKELMPEQSPYKPWIRLGVELLLLAVLVVILARPRGGATETSTTMKGIEVMICLDVSNSMNAASSDEAPEVSRLQRSKQVLEKLIDRLTGNKVGLIVFAGNAYMQMPITGDAQSAKMYLNSINTDMVPTQGTAIGAAINMAGQCFSSNPRTQKTIIVITDGENFEDDAVSSAEEARKKGITVNVVGIGSVNGAPVPTADGEVLTDENGSPAVSKLNEKGAMEIAKGGTGCYVNGAASDAVDELHEQLMKLSKSELGNYTYSLENELFPIFAWIAFFLIIAEMFILERKNPLLKRYNFFTKKGGQKK
ncbi:MAG: VWA domain-containing protein [Bacteroidales bacterium]|nr:VWA domain-containing protein [Bacteroidales bacterium]